MFPWLTVIGGVPLVGAGVVASLPKGRDALAKRLALATSLIVLCLTIAMAARFDPDGPRFQFTETLPWIPSFGIHYALGVDGIALVLIGLTAVLMPLVLLGGWNEAETHNRGVRPYFALLLIVEFMSIAVFAARDVFLFYVFFEAILIPMYFIIGGNGGARRSYAAVKFLMYSLFGGLLMLAAVIALYVISARGPGHGSFLFGDLVSLNIGFTAQVWLFLGFFIAFAIKAPMWPFHTWLPDAAAEAPPAGGAVLLVGVLDKIGTFGMLRYCLPLFPDASRYFVPLMIVLSVIGLVYGAILCLRQVDMRRLLAYMSISHFGLITLGIFAMTSQGQSGATLYMVNHGLVTAVLFIVVGYLITRRQSARIPDYTGVQSVAPMLAGTFLVAGLAALALPGLNAFASEFLVLVGTYTRYPVAAGFATAGIILAALYILWMFQRAMTGPVRDNVRGMRDLSRREMAAIAPLLVLIIGLGLYPKPVLDLINPAVRHTMQQVGVSDPGISPQAPRAEVRGGHESGASADAAGAVDEQASVKGQASG